MPPPCFTEWLPVEDEQDRADDEEYRFIDRAGDRQEAERDKTSEGFRDAPVASEDLHSVNEVARPGDHPEVVALVRTRLDVLAVHANRGRAEEPQASSGVSTLTNRP
jgi:hypothetical protein